MELSPKALILLVGEKTTKTLKIRKIRVLAPLHETTAQTSRNLRVFKRRRQTGGPIFNGSQAFFPWKRTRHSGSSHEKFPHRRLERHCFFLPGADGDLRDARSRSNPAHGRHPGALL